MHFIQVSRVGSRFRTYLHHPSPEELARYPAVVPAPTPSLPYLKAQTKLARRQEDAAKKTTYLVWGRLGDIA
jgi:hypothetical protein